MSCAAQTNLNLGISESVVELIRSLAVPEQIDQCLSCIQALGRGDVTVANKLHLAQVHAHCGHLVHICLLLGRKAQDVKGFLQQRKRTY